MYKLHFRISVHVNTALTIGQKEQIWVFIPRNLIHFKLELLLSYNFVCPNIDERNKIFLVANS